MASLFYPYEPAYVKYLIPYAKPESPYFVQNLAYLCSAFGAAGINDDNPKKIIDRCDELVDIKFVDLFEEVPEPTNIFSTNVEEYNKPKYFLTTYRTTYDYNLHILPIKVPALGEKPKADSTFYRLKHDLIDINHDAGLVSYTKHITDEDYIQPLSAIIYDTMRFYYKKPYSDIKNVVLKFVPCDKTPSGKIVISLNGISTLFYNQVCQ